MSPTPPTVLVVEDNAGMRSLLRHLLEDGGAVVHECDDGNGALEAYERLHPDMVVMDIKMGGMDGLAATRAIRRSDPNAQIVIVTEQRDPRYRRAATDAGARAFLLKEDLLALPALLTDLPG